MATLQGERLARVEQAVEDVRDDVGEVKADVKDIKASMANFANQILAETDKRYAPRLAGVIIFAFCGLILISAVTIAIINPFKQAARQTTTVITHNPDGTTTTQTLPSSSKSVTSTPAGTTTTTAPAAPTGSTAATPAPANPTTTVCHPILLGISVCG